MRLTQKSNITIKRENKDWYSINENGKFLGEIERVYGPHPACRFDGYVAYLPGAGMQGFKPEPRALLQAAQFIVRGQ